MDLLSADWGALLDRVVAAQRHLFAESPGSAERTVYEGVGEGGDRTLRIDRQCEDLVFAELEMLAAGGASFVAISEERGEVAFGGGGEARVVVDPIDGSLNARRTIPSHSLSVAVSSGPSMADVEVGFVHDFGAGETFLARSGHGATLGGSPIAVGADGDRMEVVGVEAAEPAGLVPFAAALGDRAFRLRVVGSLAITGCYVAAGRFDAMTGLRPCRSVDVAAAQLIVREAGGVVAFGERELDRVGLGLGERYPVAAAAGAWGLGVVADAARAGAA